MDGTEDFSDIGGRTARSIVDFETVACGGFVEIRAVEGAGEGFEELLDGSGDSVVDFVAGSPRGYLFVRKSSQSCVSVDYFRDERRQKNGAYHRQLMATE